LHAPAFSRLLAPIERRNFDEIIAATPELLTARDVLQSDEIFSARPQVYKFGLTESLVDIAEAYLGEPCFYLGGTLKRERADRRLIGARGWHRDIEDDRMLRLLIYLNDVGAGGGPFEYALPLGDARPPAEAGYSGGYLDEQRASILAPRERRREVLGAKGQAIFFDGIRIFHRAQPPSTQERLSLTFSYVTRQPRELRLTARLSRQAHAEVVRDLPRRIAACVPKPRLL
jgi:hypothetical protein